jgi:hypothetical protein
MPKSKQPAAPDIVYVIAEFKEDAPATGQWLPERYESRKDAKAALKKMKKPEKYHILETR